MVKAYAVTLILGLSLLAGTGLSLAAQPPGAAALPELVGSLEEWNPAAGYLVMNGTRYPLAPGLELTSSLGEAVERTELERGMEIGVFAIDGQVQRVILFR